MTINAFSQSVVLTQFLFIADLGSGPVGWIVIVTSSGLRVETSFAGLVTALRGQIS